MKFILFLIVITLIYNNSFSQNWSTPIVIGNSGYPTRAEIAVDSNNFIHVVFEMDEDNNHKPNDIYYSYFNGSVWVPQVNISQTDTISIYPEIKVDRENSLHVIWGDPKFPRIRDIFQTVKNDGIWSPPSILFHAPNDTFTVATIRFDFDNRNRLHLMWFQVPYLKYRYVENNILSEIKVMQMFAFTQDFKIHNDRIHLAFISAPINLDESLYYRSYHVDNVITDSANSSDSNVVRNIQGHPIRDPQIFVDSNDRIHLIWVEGTDPHAWANEIYHMYSDDGINWSQAVDVTHNDGTSHMPGVVIDSKDVIHMVWAQSLYKSSLVTDHIGYVYFDGESWSEPQEILSPVNSKPSLDVDNEDYLHIVYDVKLDGKHKVVYSTTRPTTGGVSKETDEIPGKFELLQNYPNPFNSSTMITFSLPTTDEVSVSIYNIKGELVNRVINKNFLTPGLYSVQWNGSDDNGKLQSSGIYFYMLETDKFIKTKKMILLL